MKNSYIIWILTLGVLVLVGFFAFSTGNGTSEDPGSGETPSNQVNHFSTEKYPAPSLPAFADEEQTGSDLQIGRVLREGQNYTEHYITYESNGLTISGIMNIPNGEGPHPLVVLNHGYIDPEVYTNGRGLSREQGFLANNGYVVLHTDYRGHAESDDVEEEDWFRMGYVSDAINAVKAVRNADLDFVDTQRVAMMGHSMGGGVTQKIMVTHPDLIDAAMLYAPVSTDARVNFNEWMRDRAGAEKIVDQYGEPGSETEDSKTWDGLSPINFINRINTPIILHHGTADESVPLRWSQRTVNALEEADKEVDFYTYENAPHEFVNHWSTMMNRNLQFLETNL